MESSYDASVVGSGLRIMRDVAVMTGAGVGGGSLSMSTCSCARPTTFRGPRLAVAIDAATLRPYYDRTEAALDPRLTPDEPALPKSARSMRGLPAPECPPSGCRSRCTSATRAADFGLPK